VSCRGYANADCIERLGKAELGRVLRRPFTRVNAQNQPGFRNCVALCSARRDRDQVRDELRLHLETKPERHAVHAVVPGAKGV